MRRDIETFRGFFGLQRTCRIICGSFAFGVGLQCIGFADEVPSKIDYQEQIKSLIRERCFACHGPLRQEGGLRLDTREAMITGGDSGNALIPKEADKSLLLQRISSADIANRMPPEHEGESMRSEQIDLLRRWIEMGAEGIAGEEPEPDPRAHWAFQAITKPQAPHSGEDGGKSPHPIDFFLADVYSKHQIDGLERAPNEVLLRRLSFDLIGLPPTLEEYSQVPAEWDPQWYSQQVQRLLQDPRHGERWARHWMDVWRFSDWWGLGDQLRNSQLHMWHWRDWIIENLNADRPYDTMVQMMLAADEISPEDFGDLRATGFLARNYFLFNRNQWMDETIEHVSKAFLGLTMNCAKCHDHKYDPIEQTDYYRMRAIFEPYHVRLDQVAGELDLNKNGLPRVFEALLDTPTYRFERGEESAPDKSEVMMPGVPEFLSNSTFAITPVKLPGVAWQPERRPWVIPEIIAKARGAIDAAEKSVAEAQQVLSKAQEERDQWLASRVASEGAASDGVAVDGVATNGVKVADTPVVLLKEDFQNLDATRWQTVGGEWKHEAGKLQQLRDGQERSILRWLGKAPRDFDVSLKFSILGGSTYRSVGITFDATADQPKADSTNEPSADPQAASKGLVPGPNDSEVMVYVSAHAPDPKVQAAYAVQGAYHYPPEGRASMPVMLQQAYTLRVQVRGDLVNASVDGQPKVAWKIPIDRREGGLRLTAFDVQVAFHEVEISTLPASVPMREPGGLNSLDPEAKWKLAGLGLEAAQRRLENARLEVEMLEARRVAWEARWAREDGEFRGASDEELLRLRDQEKPLVQASVRIDRQVELGKAKLRYISASTEQIKAAPEKKEAADKELESAKQAVEKQESMLDSVEGDLVRFVGGKWSATRFLNSGADDPALEFRSTSTGRRSALARWITDKSNPLTARVAVNHIWSRHFGEPLVASVFDFGNKGTKTEHRKLLDWLACELMENGWSIKHIHRLILESEHYRRSSRLPTEGRALEVDPDNRMLWRRTPIRLESQVVRDSILALAGRLDNSIGGPSVAMKDQADSVRRSLYFFHSNNERNLLLTTFDEALVKECYRREQSIVPQQALALSNSKLVLESCVQIADRISATSDTEEAFVRGAFLWLLGIRANDEAVGRSNEAMARWRGIADTGLGQGHPQRERVLLIWALLNHNDFVTLR
ncbi:MAG: hypothetical protein RL069_382 [Planctomycetota bacterium]